MSRGWMGKGLILIVVLLTSIAIAQGATIESADTTITAQNGMAEVSIKYSLRSEIVEDIAITVPKDVRGLEFNVEGFNRECQLEDREEDALARCGSTRKGIADVAIRYETSSMIGKLGDQTIIKFNDKLPFKTDEYNVTIKLPEGYAIPQEDEQDFYINPEPTEITSDGRRIILEWDEKELTRFSANVIISKINNESTKVWAIISVIIVILSFLITLVIVLIPLKREPTNNASARKNSNEDNTKNEDDAEKEKKHQQYRASPQTEQNEHNGQREQKQKYEQEHANEQEVYNIRSHIGIKKHEEKKQEINEAPNEEAPKNIRSEAKNRATENPNILPGFIESEKKVVDILKSSEKGELWQKEIQRNCDFSKAKLSRIIRNLETRGVIEKEAYGNTNKIILKTSNNEY